MEKPTILIAGGYDKKEDYTELMGYIKDKVKALILLGDTAKNIAATADRCGFSAYTFVKDYPEAVKTAKEKAESGDVVLLSPACASWDMFANYEDRGDLFKQLVKS
jgi:UDP-N-acetylmuramoylalanine--D-glutamate ligase